MDTDLQSTLNTLTFDQAKQNLEAAGFPQLTETARQAGNTSTPQTTPSIDAGKIGTAEAQPMDTRPIDEFQQRFGSSKDIMDTINSTDFLRNQYSDQADATVETISALLGESRDVEEIDLKEEANIPKFEQQLQDIMDKANIVSASLSQGEVKEEGRVVPMEVITGRQNQLRRQAAAELEGLAAQASILEGRIEGAENRISRILDRKYGMIKAQLETQKALLERIETKEAAAQSLKISLMESELEQKINRENNAYDSVMTALSFGNISPDKGAELIDGLTTGYLEPTDIISAIGGKLRDPIDVINEQIKWAELSAIRKAQENVANGGYTEDQSKVVNDLTTQLRGEPSYKEMFEIRAGYNTAVTGYEQENGFGDIAMVNGYQRMIDPGATVRGEDIKTQAEAVSYIQRALNIKGQVLVGDRFTPETRTKLKAAIDSQYAVRVKNFNTTTKARYETVLQKNPTLSGADVSFADIGDTFELQGTEPQEPASLETAKLGDRIIFGNQQYDVVGFDENGDPLFEPVTN